MEFELFEEDLADAGFPISDIIKTKYSINENGFFVASDDGEFDLVFKRNKSRGFSFTLPDEVVYKYWDKEDSGYIRPCPAYIGFGRKMLKFFFP